MQKSSAWPLATVYAVLIVYASLYPFEDWRDQGIAPWAFALAGWPAYWSEFDLASNLVGYAPLGFLLTLGALRSTFRPAAQAWALCWFACAMLSLVLEMLQSYLPMRVPSLMDLATNSAGSALGATLAWWLERRGALDRWSRVRARWFVDDARGAMVLLAIWPAALLFPTSVSFGLGQIFERLEAALALALKNTPFIEWMPFREAELQPLLQGSEILCVALGALAPVLLANSVIRDVPRRLMGVLLVLTTGVAMLALSSVLSYGPAHAWAWLADSVRAGLVVALVFGAVSIGLSHRACAVLLLLALAVQLTLLNGASANVYLEPALQSWEQGRFIRFHGLALWLGWLWPYAVLAYVLQRVVSRAS